MYVPTNCRNLSCLVLIVSAGTRQVCFKTEPFIFAHRARFNRLGESFVPDLNTGTANHEFQFDVPKGGDTAPQLSLSYNSGLGNGILGLGRRLSIPYIQRQTEKACRAIKEMAKIEQFYYRIRSRAGGSGPRPIPSEICHRFCGLSALRSRLASPVSRWHSVFLWSKRATNTVQSQSGEVFRWHLSKVKHLNGDVTYHYQSLDDTQQVYVSDIEYSQSGAQSMKVAFEYQARPDELLDYRPSFELLTKQRLSKITMRVAGQDVRHYQLHAELTPWRTQSQLTEIAQLDTSGQKTLMTQRFGYTSARPTEKKGYLPTLATAQLSSPSVDFIDLNGDGLADMIDTSNARHRYWLHQGIDQNGEPLWSNRRYMGVNLHANIRSPSIKNGPILTAMATVIWWFMTVAERFTTT